MTKSRLATRLLGFTGSVSEGTLLRLAITTWLVTSAGTVQSAPDRMTEGNRTTENIPSISKPIIDRAAQYSNIRSATPVSWHPSGDAILVSTRFGSTNQLHLVTQPMGTRQQLTFFKEPISGGEFAPGKPQILFSYDKGGDENYQGFVLDLNDGRVRQLTPDGSRNSGLIWSSDGLQVAYMSNRDDAGRFDIWVAETANPESTARMLVKGTGFYWAPVAWSRDNSKLLVRQVASAVDSRAFVVDVASGEMSRIGPPDIKASYGGFSGGVFNKEGTGVYLPSDLGGEFTQLRYVDLTTGEIENISKDIPWNVEALDINKAGDQVAFVTNEDGISRLYLLSTRTHRYRQIKTIPTGLIRGLEYAPDDNRILLGINRATASTDAYIYHQKPAKLERWTRSEIGGLNPDNFVPSSLIHYASFDGLEVPAFVYKPRGALGKRPVMISIHGGPEGQVRPYFSSRVQYLVNELGAIVITPNVRGSAGYGKSYLDMDNGLKREDSVRDIGALLDWIETQPDMDASRVGVIGGSYGGYMVLASMTHYNDRLRAGVNYFGVSNFVTFLQNTADYRRDHRRQEYGDERNEEIYDYLNSTAPANNTDKITKPLFVLQGANDPRVPASESEQIVENVRANGSEVWYVLFDDEGHGFRKKDNQDYSNAAVGAFLKAHLFDK